jgi:hypothetical protein
MRPSALSTIGVAADDDAMNIVCERCGAVVAIGDPNAHLNRVARDATDSEPRSFLITTQDATGSRLLHRCVVVDDHARGRNST